MEKEKPQSGSPATPSRSPFPVIIVERMGTFCGNVGEKGGITEGGKMEL